MTDKQIIIDGINVAECVYRAEEKCILKDDECYFFPNCHYKLYKRKEQECEEFKELYNYYSFNKRKPKNITELKICVNGTNEELIRLQQENKELKKLAETHCAETINMQKARYLCNL